MDWLQPEYFTQYLYDPYGNVTVSASGGGGSFGNNAVGHQGLFFDRLSADSETPVLRPLMADLPAFMNEEYVLNRPISFGVYQNRNRAYSASLGRFLQCDPVATGQPVIDNEDWFNGRPLQVSPATFDAYHQYADGLNRFEYVGGNSLNRSDPLGLEWDDFDIAIGGLYEDRLMAYSYTRDALAHAKRGSFLSQLYARMAFAWDDFVWDQNEAALYSLAFGGFLARACFEEGTPVAFDNGIIEPIECVYIGARVMSWSADPRASAADCVIDPARWRLIRLEALDPERGTVSTCLLRDVSWVSAAGAELDGELRLAIPEIAFAGWAQVCSVEPCPPDVTGPLAGLVTGTFQTERAPIVSVYLDSLPEPIGATASHPFYSLDRSRWVGAGDLKPGERLQTAHGQITITRVEARQMPRAVYNLEVHGTHTYFVSEALVWVHNACTPDQIANARGYRTGMGDPADWKFIRNKPGSGATSHDGLYRKVYEIWEDALGAVRELHYFQRADGSIFDLKIVIR